MTEVKPIRYPIRARVTFPMPDLTQSFLRGHRYPQTIRELEPAELELTFNDGTHLELEGETAIDVANRLHEWLERMPDIDSGTPAIRRRHFDYVRNHPCPVEFSWLDRV